MKSKRSLDSLLKRVGSGLSRLRVEKGYTSMAEFTERYGLPLIHYWRIENGKANITLKTLLKLLAIHQLTIEDFFCLLSNYG